jgi:hypothetical protein
MHYSLTCVERLEKRDTPVSAKIRITFLMGNILEINWKVAFSKHKQKQPTEMQAVLRRDSSDGCAAAMFVGVATSSFVAMEITIFSDSGKLWGVPPPQAACVPGRMVAAQLSQNTGKHEYDRN